MATAVAVLEAIVIPRTIEVLGPDGPYELRRAEIRKEYSIVVKAAEGVTAITTAEQAEEATKLGRLLQVSQKEVEAFYKPIKSGIDALKAPILAAEKTDCDTLMTQKNRLGGMLTKYQQQVERERQEAERLAREAAHKAAQEELLNRAVELDLSGDAEAAASVLEEPIIAAPVVTQASAPARFAGSIARKTYRCQVTNLMELVKAVAAGTAPLAALKADESYLNKKAGLDKDSFCVPGCKLETTSGTAFRG